MNKITSELQVEDADQIAFAFFYRFGVDTILDEPWLMTRSRIIDPHVTEEPRHEQPWVDDLDVPTVTQHEVTPSVTPTRSWTRRFSSSWLDRARGASSWSWRIGGQAMGSVVGETIASMAGLPNAVGQIVGAEIGDRAASGVETGVRRIAGVVWPPPAVTDPVTVDEGYESAQEEEDIPIGTATTVTIYLKRKCGQQLSVEKDLANLPRDDGTEAFIKDVWLSKKIIKERDKELTFQEKKLFEKEVNEAKTKELASWVENGAFEVLDLQDAPIKPQTGRWVITWKLTPEGSWVVKARFVIRGFQDAQGSMVVTKSATAAKVAQRLLVSTAVTYKWKIISVDISTAFLKGTDLKDAKTVDGKERRATLAPPVNDFWQYLPKHMQPKGNWNTAVAHLLTGVYGLKDAPALWSAELFRTFKEEIGCIASIYDDATFYIRSAGALACMATVHVDDIALTGEPWAVKSITDHLQARFGKDKPLKVQEEKFKHVGENYVQFDDGSCCLNNWDYIEGMNPVPIEGKLDEECGERGMSLLRSINGTIAYGCLGQPHLYGATSVSASHVAKDAEGKGPTWGDIQYANDIVTLAKAGNKQRQLHFKRLTDIAPPLTGKHPDIQLLLVSDSAFGNLGDKASQGGWVLLLVGGNGKETLGGYCHVLDVGSKRSARVAKSTWSAEMLSATVAFERGELLAMWLKEIWQGIPQDWTSQVYRMSTKHAVDITSIVDCKGLFDSVTARNPGKLTDKSMVLWLAAYREAISQQRITSMCWIPTESMLADGLTKWLTIDHTWSMLYEHGFWSPFYQPWLPEDFVRYEDGQVTRYRQPPWITNPDAGELTRRHAGKVRLKEQAKLAR